jgi:hypothetical protein
MLPSTRVMRTPKAPMKPRKLKTSSFFLMYSSYSTFSRAYKKAPPSARKSPKSGLLGLESSD